MEKFIKQYGILVLVGVAVYWFFIRKKDEEEVVVDIGDGEGESNFLRKGHKWVYMGGGNWRDEKIKGVGSGGGGGGGSPPPSRFLPRGHHWVYDGGGVWRVEKDKGVSGGGDCCATPPHCCYNPVGHCTQCVSSSAIGYGKPPRSRSSRTIRRGGGSLSRSKKRPIKRQPISRRYY